MIIQTVSTAVPAAPIVNLDPDAAYANKSGKAAAFLPSFGQAHQ